MRTILFILLFILFTSSLHEVQAQVLRIDVEQFDREANAQITNGDRLNYILRRAEQAKKDFGKLSPEYLALQRYYLDEHERIFNMADHYEEAMFNLQKRGRAEMIDLVRNFYGDSSYHYSVAVIRYGMIQTNLWNNVLTNDQAKELDSLFLSAESGLKRSKGLEQKVFIQYLCLLEEGRSNIYYKTGDQKKEKEILDSALALRNRYEVYDAAFASKLQWYASTILGNDVRKQIDFLLSYDSLIWERFAQQPKIIYHYQVATLSHLISASAFNTFTTDILQKADSLCILVFGKDSHEHIKFQIRNQLQLFRKTGMKSRVYQLLASIQEKVLANKSLLTIFDGLYYDYNYEWYSYYSSVGEEQVGVGFLTYAAKYIDSTWTDRSAFTAGKSIYASLSDYYQFRNFDSCLHYTLKIIRMDEAAKKRWGDHTIHSYGELAKKIFYTEKTKYYELGLNFAQLNLKEMKSAYGENSSFFRSALYTLGQYDLLFSNGKTGIEKTWPQVYSKLADSLFIPPLNESIFQSYGYILDNKGMYDSADYFYQEIFKRNEFGSLFRVLGFDELLQLSALKDLQNQKAMVLTKIYQRGQTKRNYNLSIELASSVFEKNKTIQLQVYLQAAREYGIKSARREYEQFLKADKRYDSLINSSEYGSQENDNFFREYDTYKNWLLESYYYNVLMKSGSKDPVIKEPNLIQMQSKLKEGDLLIDIKEFQLNDRIQGFSVNPSYAIILLDKNSGKRLNCIILDEADKLVNYAKEQDYQNLSDYLGELIKAISPYKNIYVISDGVFSLINFNALTDEKGNYLIFNKKFHYLSSGQKLFDSVPDKEKGRTAYFFGVPDFMGVDTNEGRGPQGGFFTEQFVNLFGPLENTKTEIRISSDVLKKKGWKTWLYEDKECSEKNFRKIQSADIIHVATHGFYMDEESDWSESILESENPYLKNGVIFGAKPAAGAGLDNILTSFEVFRQDLHQVSLVVLSACQTAKGKINAGEGVFGLQKALRVAGVKNLILTTKNVDDKATQYLMVRFYTEVAKGIPYEEALRKAQLQMLEHPEYKKTDYWAPFLFILN